jgi:hypothetical protein
MLKRFNINNVPLLRGKERLPFERINAKLISLGWDSSIEYATDYGWYILAMKDIPSWGTDIKRVKPFKIISPDDLFSALKLQDRLRNPALVEILPYKIYKGNRIFFPEVIDFVGDFMSETKFPLFKTSDFSLEKVDESKAKKNKDI